LSIQSHQFILDKNFENLIELESGKYNP